MGRQPSAHLLDAVIGGRGRSPPLNVMARRSREGISRLARLFEIEINSARIAPEIVASLSCTSLNKLLGGNVASPPLARAARLGIKLGVNIAPGTRE